MLGLNFYQQKPVYQQSFWKSLFIIASVKRMSIRKHNSSVKISVATDEAVA